MGYACEYCGKEFDKPITSGHKRKCPEFLKANPNRKPLPCLCGHKSTSLTQMKRHRKGCEVWQNRDKEDVRLKRQKATFEKKYGEGVTNAASVPGSAEKRAATNLERYGAHNPFCKGSSLYERVQSYWDWKDRTAHLDKNNFARSEIKEKIRQYWQKHHGVDNGSQVPEIRAKQLATNKERYGDEQTLRVPEIRDKGRQTLIDKFGVSDAAQAPEIQEKIKETNLSRYGVPWTSMNPQTRDKMEASQIRHYGSLYFASQEGMQMVKDTTARRLKTAKETNLRRYNAPHFMQNPELARKHLEHQRRSGPNSLELAFQKEFPQFLFVGDGSYWRYLPQLKQNKNPDFILPGSNKANPFHGAYKVVEIFGDYWHSIDQTGKPEKEHEHEVIGAWKEVGMDCLVLWEKDINADNWVKLVSSWMEPVDFNFDSIIIDSDKFKVVEFLNKYHYAGFGRSSKIILNGILDGETVIAIKFSTAVRQGIATSLGFHYKQILELDRFCIHPAYHKKNFASWFMAQAISKVRRDCPSVKCLVSFADPRFGHIGTIYRASNWEEVGKTAKSYYYATSAGEEMNKKTLYNRAKRRAQTEREYAELNGYLKVWTPPKIKYVYHL